MIILPKLRCPGCGKNLNAVTVNEVPKANRFEDCLRRCPDCRIGATNAKNPAKVKYIHADALPPDVPPVKP